MHVDLNSIIDCVNLANQEIAGCKVSFVLNAEFLSNENYTITSLNWDSIPYGKNELERIPDNKRGIYAFVVCHNNAVLPMHGYIMYIGIAGRDSSRTLRARYKEYLNEKKIMERFHIARMIATWHRVLRFFFAPVDDDVSADDLKALEKQLNDALLPPFSKGDLSAELKAKRSAFP